MDIANNLQAMLFTTMNMNLINRMNSNNGTDLNTFLSLILLICITIGNKYIDSQICNRQIFKIVSFFYGAKNEVEFSGRTSTLSNPFDREIAVAHSFSDSFKALWDFLNKKIETNKSVYKIKEVFKIDLKMKNKCDAFYIVSQPDSFIIDKQLEIYAYTNSKNEDLSDDVKKTKNTTEIITIILYSYKSSITTIKDFVKNITDNYINSIAELRENKKFIYEIVKTKFEECRFECWNECIFESNRTFKNLFFDRKSDILSKIHFFLKNKQWYDEKGIPYTLGIGLHGPPGTGKTSFIKALANETGRHIINFSFKVVKTKKDLLSVFFEDRYNSENKKSSIGFDKKIIVFEDIDCIGDIVLKRDEKMKQQNKPSINYDVTVSSFIDKLVNIETEGQRESIKMAPMMPYEEPITLDDILNVWDGLRETPGRIIVISSNHYDKLDPALTRPGRIDISLELTNASHNTISEIYFNLFKTQINSSKLAKIKPNFYSPAEIINIYNSSNCEQNKMLDRLIKNRKVS